MNNLKTSSPSVSLTVTPSSWTGSRPVDAPDATQAADVLLSPRCPASTAERKAAQRCKVELGSSWNCVRYCWAKRDW
jgi:hypothetical protein